MVVPPGGTAWRMRRFSGTRILTKLCGSASSLGPIVVVGYRGGGWPITRTPRAEAFKHHCHWLRSSAFTGCASQNVYLLLQTGCYDISIHPRHLFFLPTVIFHVRFRHPDDGCGLLPHIVCTFRPFVSLHSASGHFQFLVPPYGTTCLSTSHLRRHSRFSDNDSVFRSYQDTIIWLLCYYYHSLKQLTSFKLR